LPQNSVKADQRHLVMSKKEILRIIDTLLEEELKGFGNQSKTEPPHFYWSMSMFRKRRTENGEQATEAGRDCLEVKAS